MVIRKFKVFTLDDLLIYGFGCSFFSVAVFARAVQYNWNALPLAKTAITALVSFCMCAISAYLFYLRWTYKKSIYGYTKQGVAVIFNRSVDVLGFNAIEEQVENAIKFFSTKWSPDGTLMLASEDKLRDWVNGAAYTLGQDVLIWHATGTNLTIKALGLTFGKNAGSRWLTTETIEEVTPLIRHELGHVMINAYRSDLEAAAQHKLMASLGWQ